MIDPELLEKYGAVKKSLTKGAFLFHEGDAAIFFYQIVSGSVKMNNYHDSGQETIQGIFKQNQSFGEPPLFGNFKYPANAEISVNAVLLCLEKNRFIQLLNENPNVSIHLLEILSQRLKFKAVLSKQIKGQNAENQITALLKHLYKTNNNSPISITRQTIANLTGLRVETVIRAIKKLKEKKIVLEENNKLSTQ